MPNRKNDDSLALVQKYVDLYAQSLAREGKDVNPSDVIGAIGSINAFAAANEGDAVMKKLNIENFQVKSSELLLSNITQLDPTELLRLITNFPKGSEERTVFVKKTLEQFRNNDYDINKFTFPQLVTFISLVNETKTESLQLFQTYLDKAVSFELYQDQELQDNFGKYISIIYTFALEGLLEDNQAMYKFMMMLNDKLQSSRQDARADDSINKNLVNLVWTLVYRETCVDKTDAQQTSLCPTIPKLLEFLASFKRTEELSKLELLQIYQIQGWVQSQIDQEKLPEIFSRCVPPSVYQKAKDRFHEFDAKARYPDDQVDIAKKLLKLRVTFAENRKIHGHYRVDIMELEKKNCIYLVSDNDEGHQTEDQHLLGLEQIKRKWLENEANLEEFAVRVVDVDKYRQMNKMDKFKYLATLTQAGQARQSKFS